MPKKIKLEKEQIENLLNMGYSIPKIGKELNVSLDTIRRNIVKLGIVKPEKNKSLRTCWKCKQNKPLIIENFSIDNKDCFGFQKACKICQNANSKLYNDNNKEYFKQKGKEKYKKEDNSKRYQKYKESYLKRSADFSKTIRGKLDNLLQAARGRAKKNNIEINIDLDFLLHLYEQQNGKCKLTDLNFTLNVRKEGQHFNPFNPSIDKINSKGGYTKDNIRLVCVIVNLSLNEFGEENFKLMCEAYISKSKNKGE